MGERPDPPSLKSEHEELHADLVRATKSGGRTGDAAKAVAKLMHPHFLKEKAYALPLLSLLLRFDCEAPDVELNDFARSYFRLRAVLSRCATTLQAPAFQGYEAGARMRQRNSPKVTCSRHFALTCVKFRGSRYTPLAASKH